MSKYLCSRVCFVLQHFALGLVACLALGSQCRAEELVDIRLGAGALKDPLFEMVLPPQTSPDKVQLLPSGIAVRQTADIEGKKTGVAGFKLHSSASGDFKFTLDFDCLKLEKAKAGWGQGLMIRVMTDDPATPVIAIGFVANKQFDRGWVIQINHAEGVPQERFSGELNFEKGIWSIERIGSELTLSIGKDEHSLEKIKTVNGTDASLSGVHVWCTRQETGNAPAEYLLKRLRFEADSMFVYKEAPRSFWSWWTLFAVVLGLNLLGFVVVIMRRARGIK